MLNKGSNKYMLKKSAILAAIIFASTTTAHADLLDLNVGLNYWNNNMKVGGTYEGYYNSFKNEHDFKPVIWAKVEHKVPVLPNFKLRYTDLEHDAKTTITGSIKIDDKVYTDQANIKIDAKLSHFDVTPYYNVLNNDILSLGIGINLKIGDFKIEATDGITSAKIDYKGVAPLPYACSEIKLPFDISLKGDVAGLAIGDYAFYDAEIALEWEMFDVADVGASVEAGYRKIYASADDVEDLDLTYKSDGFFAGISVNY